MGVVLTKHLTHHTSALSVGPITGQPELVHGIQNPPVHRLESISSVGQRTPNDHAHRVLQIGARHFVAQICLDDPFVGFAGTAAAGSHWIRHTRPICLNSSYRENEQRKRQLLLRLQNGT